MKTCFLIEVKYKTESTPLDAINNNICGHNINEFGFHHLTVNHTSNFVDSIHKCSHTEYPTVVNFNYMTKQKT